MFTDDVRSKSFRLDPDYVAWLATRAPVVPEPEPVASDNEAEQ